MGGMCPLIELGTVKGNKNRGKALIISNPNAALTGIKDRCSEVVQFKY